MRLCAFFILVILSPDLAFNQIPTVQDCPGAIPVCQDYYEEPDSSALSGGNYHNEIGFDDVTCTSFDTDGLWYSFTVQTSGVLRFTLKPQKPNVDDNYWIVADFDWTLFDLTNGTCADLKTSPSTYLVSSNTYGSENDIQWHDSTGINSTYTEELLSNCNGPGPDNGPPFNQDVQVLAGNNYFLFVSNPHGTPYGYTLDLSASTAIIYDDTPPELQDCKPKCGASTLTVSFSEKIQCSSLTGDMFKLGGPEGEITIFNVSSIYCNEGAEYDKEVLLKTNTDFAPGNYNLSLVKPVYDACGNMSGPDSIKFTVPGTDILSVSSTDILCYGAYNGSISINAASESNTLLYSVLGGFSYQIDDNEFDSLGPGIYEIVVKNEYDCMAERETVILTNPDVLVLTAEHIVPVDKCGGAETGAIAVSATGGRGNITYSIDGSNYNSDPVFSDLKSGDYVIYARDENNCENSVNIEIESVIKDCISMPNVFTPNNDGINDTWEIKHIDMFPEATIEIYDRWGNLLASYKGDDPGWNGRYKGEIMPPDTYFYNVSIGIGKAKKGYVTLIR
jgi:gliding motility-associated-like protein